jgi:hypothetical protein
MKTKTFDCVKMKHEAAERIYELTKNMTFEERLAFWQAETEKLRQDQKRARERKEWQAQE